MVRHAGFSYQGESCLRRENHLLNPHASLALQVDTDSEQRSAIWHFLKFFSASFSTLCLPSTRNRRRKSSFRRDSAVARNILDDRLNRSIELIPALSLFQTSLKERTGDVRPVDAGVIIKRKGLGCNGPTR